MRFGLLFAVGALAASVVEGFSFCPVSYQATPWDTRVADRITQRSHAFFPGASRNHAILRNWNNNKGVGAARMGISEEVKWTRPAAKGKRDIVIGTRVNTAIPVITKHDEGCELSKYMQLPPEQYTLIPLPNKAKLERTENRLFRLKVCPAAACSLFPSMSFSVTTLETWLCAIHINAGNLALENFRVDFTIVAHCALASSSVSVKIV